MHLVPAAARRRRVVVVQMEPDVVEHGVRRNTLWRGCRRARLCRWPAHRAPRAIRSPGSLIASAVCILSTSFAAGDRCPRSPASGRCAISFFSRSSWNSTERGLSGSSARRSTRLRRPAQRVLAPVGHDAVADLQHHVERTVRRILARQPGERAGDLDAALQPAADLEEAPAGEAVHVLVRAGRRSRRACAGSPSWRASRRRPAPRLSQSGARSSERSRSASQPSGEKRSRICPAL